jgi:hypothetical protein
MIDSIMLTGVASSNPILPIEDACHRGAAR